MTARHWRRFLVTGLALSALLWACVPRHVTDPAADLLAARARAHAPGAPAAFYATNPGAITSWLAGKVDFAPPVREFPDDGVTLHGARTENIHDQVVAVLLYQQAGQTIELTGWPGNAAPRDDSDGPAHLLSWTQHGIVFWAISDGDAATLRQFRALWQLPDHAPRNHARKP